MAGQNVIDLYNRVLLERFRLYIKEEYKKILLRDIIFIYLPSNFIYKNTGFSASSTIFCSFVYILASHLRCSSSVLFCGRQLYLQSGASFSYLLLPQVFKTILFLYASSDHFLIPAVFQWC